MAGIKRVSGLFGGLACLFAFAFCACESVPENCGDGSRLNSATEFCFGGQAYPKCGGETYDPTAKKCEGGILKTQCGVNYYDPATEFCYGGQAYPKCGGGEYDPTVKKCEDGVMKSKCGNEYYNPATNFCVGDGLYSKCGGEEYDPASQKCESNVLKTKCGNDYYDTTAAFCAGDTVYSKCGGKKYDPATETCENNVLKGKCGGIDYNPTIEYCSADGTVHPITYTLTVSADPAGSGSVSRDPDAETYNVGTLVTVTATAAAGYTFTGWTGASTVTASIVQITMNGNKILTANFQQQSVPPPSNTTFVDSRDGKTYKKITIGTQTWMAENLNYDVPGTASDVCYAGRENNCAEYGRLYNWATVMNGASSSSLSPSGVQGVCPAGWHIPSDAEWTTLTDYVGGASTAGTKLKSSTGWTSSNRAGTDDLGWSALPGGRRIPGTFDFVSSRGYWWSATENGANLAWNRYMYYNYEYVSRDDDSKDKSFSVRCVQD